MTIELKLRNSVCLAGCNSVFHGHAIKPFEVPPRSRVENADIKGASIVSPQLLNIASMLDFRLIISALWILSFYTYQVAQLKSQLNF